MFSDSEFLTNENLEQFTNVFELYPKAITIRSSLRSGKHESLLVLDKWYQEDLPALLQERGKEQYLTRDELVRLMQWKLARGKFRPRLVEFAASNAQELVKQCTKDGIKFTKKDVSKGLAVISKLKGIGPATASAVLAAAVPDRCCFFADEVACAALRVAGGLKYTAPEYLMVNTALQACARSLNKQQTSTSADVWTPHRVELALWSYSMLRQHKPQLLDAGEGTKRKATSDSDYRSKKRKAN